MGVSCLSFNINSQSEAFTRPSEVVEIEEWVEGVKLAYQISGLTQPELERALQVFQPDILICDDSSLSFAKETGIPFVFDLGEKPKGQPIEDHPGLQAIILKHQVGEKPDEGLIDILLSELGDVELFIELSVNSQEEVSLILNQIDPDGIILYGGKEQKPGYKDFEDLADILEFLEE